LLVENYSTLPTMSQPSSTTYANIVNVHRGVAPSDVPPGPRGLGRSLPDYGPGGLMKSRAQPLSATTAILDLPDEDCPELFPADSPTIQVTINSGGQPNLRGHILRQLISNQQIFLLNYGRADTWFFTSNAFDVTTLHNTHKTHGPYTLFFTLHEKNRVNGTLRWVPPTLSDRTLIKALQPYSNKEPSIYTIPLTTNRSFSIHTDNPANIPHYIQLNYRNKSHNILIAINDRKQACQTCSSTSHWTNRCQTLNLESTPNDQIPAQSTAPSALQGPMPSNQQHSSTEDAAPNPKTPPKKQPPAQQPAPPAQPATTPSSQQITPIAKPPPTTSSQLEALPAQTTPSPSKQQATIKKPINPSRPASTPSTPSKQATAARSKSDKPATSRALTLNAPFFFSDMDTTLASFKRKKEDSPTEEKKIIKSKKFTHDNKRCRFCPEQNRTAEETEKHEHRMHYRFLRCDLCVDKGYHTDIYAHFAENHQEVTLYDCRDCTVSLPLEGMKEHTKVHHVRTRSSKSLVGF
jgi:hypothetical protein